MNTATQNTLTLVNKPGMLTKEQEETLFRNLNDAKMNNRQSMVDYYISQIVSLNQRLVSSIAVKFRGRGLDLDDLKQEGNMGLLHAIEKFDISMGNRFSTYATYWIEQAINNALYNNSEAIRVPVYFKKLLTKVHKAQANLTTMLGRVPTVVEIAGELEMEVEEVERCLAYTNSTTSLDAAISDEDEGTKVELVSNGELNPEEKYGKKAESEMIRSLISSLPEKEQYVIINRYGLNGDGVVLTLEQIGKALNVSHERVRQIERKALSLMKSRALPYGDMFH